MTSLDELPDASYGDVNVPDDTARSNAPVTKRACDACKRRKVRCDAISTPCSNCHISRLECVYTIAPQKRGPKRKRDATTQPTFRISDHGSMSAAAIQANQRDVRSGNPIIQVQTPTSMSRGASSNAARRSQSSPYVQLQTGLAPHIIADQLITLYMHYLFPIAPTVHEPSVRAMVPLLEGDGAHGVLNPSSASQSPGLDSGDIVSSRNRTLLTAICACTALMLPASVFPMREEIGRQFLTASRETLKLHQDYDIEQPDYTALVTRFYHANALRAIGKTRLGWHVLGEAIRLTQEMRLYEESSFQNLDPVEEHLLKNIFWQIHAVDRSASILISRPISLHRLCVGAKITTSYWRRPSSDAPLLDYSTTPNALDIESMVSQGFDLCQDLWTKASDIIVKFDTLDVWNEGITDGSALVGPQHTIVITDYLEFIGMIDHFRFDVKVPDTTNTSDPATMARIQRAFDIQRVNLCVTYYCLKLVLLQRFYDGGVAEHLGVPGRAYGIALRKIDVASDMVRILSEASFESLQVNGEPCVQMIRRMGATLLNIVQETDNTSLKERAKSLFLTLLDVLSRLDSRVSQELDHNRGF